uniref:Asparagine synthetase B n=1 Tax=Eiseniibacteriota bacterium TaxID=2212470 RepID=A0A832MKF4_UNCEI
MLLALALAGGGAAPARAGILVPMDDAQTDHLRAYGLTFWALTRGQQAEWLLNYRGGSFLLADDPATEREANLRGVAFERMGGAAEAAMRATLADENMESVRLEKAPRVAVYIPPNTPPWDDAVSLALEYAQIPFAKLWDEEVLRGGLAEYDWLHLHHEDFTGQHGKFYAAYHTFPWYKEEEAVQRAMAQKLGFAKVTHLKAAVAGAIKEYVGRGGFMFGMCSATDTYDIALAAEGADIADIVYDGDPPDPQAQSRLDYSRTLAFKDFRLEMDPFVYRFSDIDVTQEASLRGPAAWFSLFDFSAKNDPVPTMLVQNHVAAVPEFLGQSTGFRRSKLKSGVLVLGEVEGTDEVKYLHGQFGRGTFTFLGGHDPEDYQHMVGDPPTDLTKHRHSPGYRLILNNVLFPAAEKKKQRT